ncbi:MAG: GNAT family N-acetyltransferase [Vulcanimicrobiaceae bacterium]
MIPARRELLVAELSDRAELAVLLDAHVPVNWPDGIYDEGVLRFFLDRLLDAPDALGWWSWYAIHLGDDDRTLVAGIGFKGPPRDGSVEIGYGVVEEFRRRGLAREAGQTLIGWALSDLRVDSIVAQAHVDNGPSQRVLAALGFEPSTPRPSPDGMLRFERKRESA